jgi:hypothetical protein
MKNEEDSWGYISSGLGRNPCPNDAETIQEHQPSQKEEDRGKREEGKGKRENELEGQALSHPRVSAEIPCPALLPSSRLPLVP